METILGVVILLAPQFTGEGMAAWGCDLFSSTLGL